MTSSVAGALWDPHPLLSLPAGPRHLEAYVKFKVWDEGAGKFEDAPPGTNVDLIDDGTGDPIDSVSIGAGGIAHFNIVNLSPEHPDIYFLVDTGSIPTPFAGHNQLPGDWSTKGWRSSDGKEFGYKKAFAASTFGTSAKPIEFEIGVRLFLQVRIESSTEPGQYLYLLPNSRILITANSGAGSKVVIDDKVDDAGTWRFFSFNIAPASDVTLELFAESGPSAGSFPFTGYVLVDKHIGLSTMTQQTVEAMSFDLGVADTKLSKIDLTSIGTDIGGAAGAYDIRLPRDDNKTLSGAFTFLRNLVEFNSLWHYVLQPNWSEFAGCRVNMRAILLGGMSLPGGLVNFPRSFERTRSDQMHEYAHQVLYNLANMSLSDIVIEYCFGDAIINHGWLNLYNPTHALLEGWAECFGYIFGIENFALYEMDEKFYASYRIDTLYKGIYKTWKASGYVRSGGHKLDVGDVSDLPNWGESVEGVFGAGLYYVFRDYVSPSGSVPPSHPPIPATQQGDIAGHSHLSWLTDQSQVGLDARERFRRAFVYPAQAMASPGDATSTGFIDAMRIATQADWPVVRDILQQFHMAFPCITGTDPEHLPATGGDVMVYGEHFTPGAKLSFDAVPTACTVEDSRTISFYCPPGSAGRTATLKVETTDGNHSAKVKYA